MTEELDCQILDAKEKFESFATVPSTILITSFLVFSPLYVNLFIQLGAITKCQGIAIIGGIGFFYFIAALIIGWMAKKEFRKLILEEKKRFSPLKKQYMGDGKNSSQSNLVNQLLINAHLFAYKDHINKRLEEEIKIMVCRPAAYTIFYSLLAIMITFIFPLSQNNTPSHVQGTEVFAYIGFIIIILSISVGLFFIKDRKRTHLKNNLAELYKRKYEIMNFIC